MKPIIEKLKADVLELEQAWAALEETREAKVAEPEPVVEPAIEPAPEVETAPEVEVAGTQTAPTE
jgi:hypothetical protein